MNWFDEWFDYLGIFHINHIYAYTLKRYLFVSRIHEPNYHLVVSNWLGKNNRNRSNLQT